MVMMMIGGGGCLLSRSEDAGDLGLDHLAQLLARLEAVVVRVVVDGRCHEGLRQDRPVVIHRLHRPQEGGLLSLGLVIEDSRWNNAISISGWR